MAGRYVMLMMGARIIAVVSISHTTSTQQETEAGRNQASDTVKSTSVKALNWIIHGRPYPA
ncbi:hypothetical protein IPC228_08590, partial [Pseudomonas aeruginosa]